MDFLIQASRFNFDLKDLSLSCVCYAWKSSDRCLGLFAESYKTSEYSAWLGISPIGHSWGFICSAFSTIFSIIFCLTWLDSPISDSWKFISPSFSTHLLFSVVSNLSGYHMDYAKFKDFWKKKFFFHNWIYSMFLNLSWWKMMINQILENFLKEEHWSSAGNSPFWCSLKIERNG